MPTIWTQSVSFTGAMTGRVGTLMEVQWQAQLAPDSTVGLDLAGANFRAQWRQLAMGGVNDTAVNYTVPWLALVEASASFAVVGTRLVASGTARGTPLQTGSFRFGFQSLVTGNGSLRMNPFNVGVPTIPNQGQGTAPWGIITITEEVQPPGGGGAATGLKLTWFQARFLAWQGAKIRREGWRDRYLEYSGSLWWLQLINPLTNVATTRGVVQAADWAVEHFRAGDWTCDAPDASALAAARTITSSYP